MLTSMRSRRALLVASLASFTVAQDHVTDYAPTIQVACPSAPLLRIFDATNQSLHPDEILYVNSRAESVLPGAWKDWIGDGSGIGYDARKFEGKWSKIGISISGGGFRAAQYGAGVLSGLDARDTSAKAAGTGGMLQVMTYMSGLSGGSWLTGSLFLNNWPTIKDLVLGDGRSRDGWLLDLNLAIPGGINIFSDENQWYFGSLLWSVLAKAKKGLDTSLTDPWARMISYHFLNQTNRRNFFTNDSAHGAGQLWSRIPQTSSYQQRLAPFPLIVINSRPVGSNLTTALDPGPVVYEVSPLEWGSFDPKLSAMMNLTYAGTRLTNGKPSNDTACVTGFDQAGFVMGTSASLFNQILDFANSKLEGFGASDNKGLLHVLSRQLGNVRTRANEVANWPSPFQGLRSGEWEDSHAAWLELIDGASNLENVPLGPMFVKARGLDVIVAVDASADTNEGWPNGTSPSFTASRLKNVLLSSHQQFPPIPPTFDAWVRTGINARPTFFGCDPVNSPPEWPMVIYLPNAPPVNGDDPVSNSETFTLEYAPKHTEMFLDQVHRNTISGFVPAALGADRNWGKCLQCAAVDRTRFKLQPVPTRSEICTKCFLRYCYDPSNPSSKNDIVGRKLNFKDPDPQGLSKTTGFLASIKGPVIGAFVALCILMAGVIAALVWWKKRKHAQAKYDPMPEEDDSPWRRQSAPPVYAYELPEHGDEPLIYSSDTAPTPRATRAVHTAEGSDMYTLPTLSYYDDVPRAKP